MVKSLYIMALIANGYLDASVTPGSKEVHLKARAPQREREEVRLIYEGLSPLSSPGRNKKKALAFEDLDINALALLAAQCSLKRDQAKIMISICNIMDKHKDSADLPDDDFVIQSLAGLHFGGSEADSGDIEDKKE
jgi:hypothetical protein